MRRKYIIRIISIILLGCYYPVLATALGDLASSMEPGTWAELKTIGFNDLLLDDEGPSSNIFQYSDCAAWDPNSEKILFIGSGHSYAGKHGAFITYSAQTNQWRKMAWPALMPEPRHAYDHNTINPATGMFYHRIRGTRYVLKYDISADTWSRLPINPVISHTSCCIAIEFFTEMGGFVWVTVQAGDYGNVILFEESTSQWSKIPENIILGSIHNFAEYSPVHKVVFFGGGNGHERSIYKLDSTSTITPLNTPPLDMRIAGGSTGTIVTVDPVSGDYLVFGADESFYVYNIIKDEWTKQQGSVPFFSPVVTGSCIFSTVATPVSTYGVNVFMKYNFDDSKVYVYKHSEDTTSISRSCQWSASESIIDAIPNPFNSSAKIQYNITDKFIGTLSIFSLKGKLLVNQNISGRGVYIWKADKFSSGLYLLKIKVENDILSKKLILIK